MLLVGSAIAVHHRWNIDVYETKIGELQLVVLEDGTRMSLNTGTHVRVDIDDDLRSVSVQGGEALFEVAKDAHRPFIVRVADSEVVALGTVFSVRLPGSGESGDEGALAVTLIEGHVTVRPASGEAVQGLSPAKPILLQPGERIRLAKSRSRLNSPAVQQLDRPAIEQVLAWKRSEAVFDNVLLRDAVAEMNRYSRTPIVLLDDATLSRLRISGVYRTSDSGDFAKAVAALHGLAVRKSGGRLELSAHQ